jgi:hypothetical protein
MPVDSKRLLAELKLQVKALEEDLRVRAADVPEIGAELRAEYGKGREAGRIGEAFESWRDGVLTQAAVHWVLGCVFVRFLEDNGLVAPALLAGAGERGREAEEGYAEYFRVPDHRVHSDREFLLHAFRSVAALPAGERLFDAAHNPVWRFPVSADAARDLLRFWRRVDPNSGELVHDFADLQWDTRFLGDLYQDLSEAAKKTYALLQTPVFVEEFILDRTLEPAIREFGLREVKLIDPTCGSGHFLLGAFERLVRRWMLDAPAENERVLVQRALDSVYGVDLNPFAVAIARFRLLVAALKASEVRRLAQAPDFTLHVATGDSLLFGTRRDDELGLGNTAAELKVLGLAYHMEDAEEADRILSQRYHVVVGNPPYITVKDGALNKTYRQLFATCHRRYSLGVPFTERFWQLSMPAKSGVPAGFIGMITANSFMKNEFGKKLIEDFFPRCDLTHIIDAEGASIPGHGTPTVILFGRNQSPVAGVVRTLMSIQGEADTPDDPTQGAVWHAILRQVDDPGSLSRYIEAADVQRGAFAKHPWSIGGSGINDVLETLSENSSATLGSVVELIGFASFPATSDLFEVDGEALKRSGIPQPYIKAVIGGKTIRDWSIDPVTSGFAPYDEQFRPIPLDRSSRWYAWIWPYRTEQAAVSSFDGQTRADLGHAWWTWYRWIRERYLNALSITYAEIETHNHFVLDRGGKVFTQTAPVIKLPVNATVISHLGLVGLLNSSTACFWLKQVAKGKHKGDGGQAHADPAYQRFHFNATKVGQFPIVPEQPNDLAEQLDRRGLEREGRFSSALKTKLPCTRGEWQQHRTEADRLLREMIALQEELDWRCYRLYGITPDELTYQDEDGSPRTPPELRLGERAFEIVLARRMEAGEEETTWFQRHGSTPITEFPAHWPDDYRALVERRIERIEQDRYVGLVERPEYKRRWNVESWDKQATAALEEWLKTRLEDARYWPERRLRSTHDLAGDAQHDADFMAVAELYRGRAGFDVHTLVRELVEAESVPFLPVLRYKPTGMRKREVWERTWEQQRQEDAIDARVERELKPLGGETEEDHRKRVAAEQKRRKQEEVGDIPRPPRYTSADFLNATCWRHRGALDVPKERFISYPHGARDNDPTHTVAWAGWNHLEHAEALATWINDRVQNEAWTPARLTPLLAGLAELIPWLKQWHNDPTPQFGRLGDFYETFLDAQLHDHGLTRADLRAWEPPAAPRGRRKKAGAGQ